MAELLYGKPAADAHFDTYSRERPTQKSLGKIVKILKSRLEKFIIYEKVAWKSLSSQVES